MARVPSRPYRYRPAGAGQRPAGVRSVHSGHSGRAAPTAPADAFLARVAVICCVALLVLGVGLLLLTGGSVLFVLFGVPFLAVVTAALIVSLPRTGWV